MSARLLIIQAVLVLAVTAVCYAYLGSDSLLAAVYGGGVALVNTLWLSLRVDRAGEIAREDPQRGVYSLYFGAVQRFVFVLVALIVGLAALKLRAEPLLLTFGVAQLAYVFGVRAV